MTKFVDEVAIIVRAGKGGDGCCSFRRERAVAFGGPDGGDGGDGANVYLEADPNVNTLVDFRYRREFKAPLGQPGRGEQRTGSKGDDLFIKVPVGTLVYDVDTDECIGDLTQNKQTLLVAKGGWHGLGNLRFKSSTNRAPRQTSQGKPGESRNLRLELQVLADVGLLGLPNAGKSTLIRAVSAAKPKVADYPFTTLYPHLGVVRIGMDQSFVMADIPGLIEGAAQGAGLGIQFLKHLNRCRVLLHLVDVFDLTADEILERIKTLEIELGAYEQELMRKPRWLVLNKIDCLNEEDTKALLLDIKKRSPDMPVYAISAVTGKGVMSLMQAVFNTMDF